jgi:uncharacterized protein YqeY
MSDLKEKINADIKTAMLAKNTIAKDVLRVLKGEIERGEQTPKGKVDVSDIEIVRIVKKLIQGITETNTDNGELEVLNKYVPAQMSEDDIVQTINLSKAIEGWETAKDMGKVMSYFKIHFEGRYDGKLLSDITKKLLV